MGSLHSLVANGGRVLVVGGHWNKGWDPYKTHPQLTFWTGERKEIVEAMRNRQGDFLPDNVRGVIISRFISHAEASRVIQEARRKRILIMPMKNDGQITQTLEEIVTKPSLVTPLPANGSPAPPTPPVVPKWAGRLSEFVAKYHQTELPTQAEGRRLFALAKQATISTTEQSVCQAVSVYRRRLGIAVGPRSKKALERRQKRDKVKAPVAPAVERTPASATVAATLVPVPVPPVAVAASPAAQAVEKRAGSLAALQSMIDEHITGLQLIREEVSRLAKENEEFLSLRQRVIDLLK